MRPKQEDFMRVTVQGTRREDVVRLLKKALKHVEGGGLGMSEHPNSYDPFLSVMVPTSWRRGQEPAGYDDERVDVRRAVEEVNALFPEPEQVCERTGVVHWRKLTGGPTRDNWAEALKILLRTPRRLSTVTMLIGKRLYRQLLKSWAYDVVLPAGEFGAAHCDGVTLIVATEAGVIPDNTAILYAGHWGRGRGGTEATVARVDFGEYKEEVCGTRC